jgi:hypothetical protein
VASLAVEEIESEFGNQRLQTANAALGEKEGNIRPQRTAAEYPDSFPAQPDAVNLGLNARPGVAAVPAADFGLLRLSCL